MKNKKKSSLSILIFGAILFTLSSWAERPTTIFLKKRPQGPTLVEMERQNVVTGEPFGTYSYIHFKARNLDTQTHQLRFILSRSSLHQVSKQLTLAAGEQASIDIPWLSIPAYLDEGDKQFEVSLEGATQELLLPSVGSPNYSSHILVLSNRFQVELLESMLADSKIKKPIQIIARSIDTLPHEWFLLSSFRVILIDGKSAASFTPAQNQVLTEYSKAGGAVVFFQSKSLPIEFLSTWSSQEKQITTGQSNTFGFGQVLFLPEEAIVIQKPTSAELSITYSFSPELVSFINELDRRKQPERIQTTDIPYEEVDRSLRSQNDDNFLFGLLSTPISIPGFNALSPWLFLGSLLLFILFVGPLNYLYMRIKKKRPTFLLISIPIIGLSTTISILLYGILSEGFHIRGAIASVSFVNQKNHEIINRSVQTLYSGLSPKELRFSSHTFAINPKIAGMDERSSISSSPYLRRQHNNYQSWKMNLDSAIQVDGSALPSRSPTTFITSEIASFRERLRFQKMKNGDLQLLSTPSFTIASPTALLIVRDFQGGYYHRTMQDILKPIEKEECIAIMTKQFSTMSRGKPFQTEAFEAFIKQQGELPKGGYAMIAKIPIEQFGLKIDYLLENHWVFGELAPEDIIEIAVQNSPTHQDGSKEASHPGEHHE